MRGRLRYAFGVLKEAMRRFTDDDHAVYAGHMAFTLLLSLGPFIVCSIILAQQFDPNAAGALVAMVEKLREGALIPDPMAALLTNLIQNVAPSPDMTLASGDGLWVVLVSSAVGLYAGSSAFEAARNGFNEAYDTRDKRHFIFRRFQSHMLALTIAGLFVVASIAFVTLTISLNIFAEAQAFLARLGLESDWWSLGLILLVVFFVGLMFWTLLLGIHITLPRGYVKGWHLYVWAQDEIDDIRAVRVPLTPGVRWSALLWLLFAVGYSFTIGNLVKFDTNHGALAGVVATLLFFYVSAAMICFGAQINIAIATLDSDGKPAWPHPHVPRPIGFDESEQEAYRVLTHPDPSGLIRRLWHYLWGGKARRRPEDVVTDEAALAAKQGGKDTVESAAAIGGAAAAAAGLASLGQ